MYLVLCHVSGKTDLVTPINSVLFCSVHYNRVRCPCCVRDLDLRCYLAIIGVIWNEC